MGTDMLFLLFILHTKKTATDSFEPMAVLKNLIIRFDYIRTLLRTHGRTGVLRLTGSQTTARSMECAKCVFMATIIVGRQGMSTFLSCVCGELTQN